MIACTRMPPGNSFMIKENVLDSEETWQVEVDEQGRLILPPEVMARYGLQPGVQVHLDGDADGVHLRRPITQLAKLYVEPTNRCNLACRMCVRNVWDAPQGQMSSTTFTCIVEGLRAALPPPKVVFGGFGEPLAHPAIIEMAAQVKHLGGPVELITNGTLLSRDMSRRLIAAGLDMLWLSLDGITPESYADLRLGAALPQVLDNLSGFRACCRSAGLSAPKLGIIFVAMKRNIAELPAVLRLSRRLGASRFLVTNVLPHTAEMRSEPLYARALGEVAYLSSPPFEPRLELPKIDTNELTRASLYRVIHGTWSVSLAGANLGTTNDRCPFIESGSTTVSWEGFVSPCLPLVYNHTSILHTSSSEGRQRYSHLYRIGNVAAGSLSELWTASEYVAFRERVRAFDFPPCTKCGGCLLSLTNEEDCFGNIFPTCGGCLWAQGVIRCP